MESRYDLVTKSGTTLYYYPNTEKIMIRRNTDKTAITLELDEEESTQFIEFISKLKGEGIIKPAETGTIKIEVCDGVIEKVKGLPEGYQYEIVECDKYGEPLPLEEE